MSSGAGRSQANPTGRVIFGVANSRKTGRWPRRPPARSVSRRSWREAIVLADCARGGSRSATPRRPWVMPSWRRRPRPRAPRSNSPGLWAWRHIPANAARAEGPRRARAPRAPPTAVGTRSAVRHHAGQERGRAAKPWPGGWAVLAVLTASPKAGPNGCGCPIRLRTPVMAMRPCHDGASPRCCHGREGGTTGPCGHPAAKLQPWLSARLTAPRSRGLATRPVPGPAGDAALRPRWAPRAAPTR